MKKLIISLLSAMALSLSGYALAGAEPVVIDTPVETPVETPAQVTPQEPACQPTEQTKCESEAPDSSADVKEDTPVAEVAS